MKYQPVPPHEVMEGECYYITHLGISDKFYEGQICTACRGKGVLRK